MESTQVGSEGPAATCALEGCDLPLPERPLDEQGRRRAGRRPRYCGKAHADQASRQRRAAGLAAVTDPLAQAEVLGLRLLPGAREALDTVGTLIAHLEAVQSGALARMGAAEADAAEARQDALAAEQRADDAEQARRRALAEAREAAQARDTAVRDAAADRRDADQVRDRAWEQVAAHERARGQSEAARTAAEQAGERLAAELHRLTRLLDAERAAAADLRERRGAAERDAELARTERQAALNAAAVLEAGRADVAAERDRLLAEADRARATVAAAQADATAARAEAAAAREAAAAARGDLAAARSAAEQAERRAAAAESGVRQLTELRSLLTGPVPGTQEPESGDARDSG